MTDKINEDALFTWVWENKYDEMCDYCAGEVSTLDDDLEDAFNYYIEQNFEELKAEYIKSI